MTHTSKFFLLMISICIGLLGCQSTYYSAMEKIGYEKRDLLNSRVKDAKQSQKDAQQEFESAYEQFATLVNFQGGDLEKKYQQLKKRYDNAKESAENVTEKRQAVETVGQALFKEWRQEITLYTSPQLRSQSTAQLKDTERQFDQLVAQLKKSEAKIAPVLNPFRDRVLYLKHNLNAKAISAMKSDNVRIQQDIRSLIKDMQDAINEADRFISTMKDA